MAGGLEARRPHGYLLHISAGLGRCSTTWTRLTTTKRSAGSNRSSGFTLVACVGAAVDATSARAEGTLYTTATRKISYGEWLFVRHRSSRSLEQTAARSPFAFNATEFKLEKWVKILLNQRHVEPPG